MATINIIIPCLVVVVFFMCKQEVELSALDAFLSVFTFQDLLWEEWNSENDMFGVSSFISALVQHC